MNLVDLVRDALAAMMYRFKPAEQYRYGGAVFLAVALAIGVANAVSLMPVLGQTGAVFALGVVLGIGRWLVLTRAMTSVLHYFGAPKTPFLGYTLATEALVLPNIVLFYAPKWGMALMLWNIWAFWAQWVGFRRISGVGKVRAVVLGYLTYFAGSTLLIFLMLMLFGAAGWLDIQALSAMLQEYLARNR